MQSQLTMPDKSLFALALLILFYYNHNELAKSRLFIKYLRKISNIIIFITKKEELDLKGLLKIYIKRSKNF